MFHVKKSTWMLWEDIEHNHMQGNAKQSEQAFESILADRPPIELCQGVERVDQMPRWACGVFNMSKQDLLGVQLRAWMTALNRISRMIKDLLLILALKSFGISIPLSCLTPGLVFGASAISPSSLRSHGCGTHQMQNKLYNSIS